MRAFAPGERVRHNTFGVGTVIGCQAVPGDSGSPIIFSDGKEYRLAAVHSAHTKNRLGGKGFAVPTASFMPFLEKLEKQIAKTP